MTMIERMDRTLYPDFGDNWDDTVFREHIRRRIEPGTSAVLDLGAGAGIVKQMNFRGIAARMCGVDPDPRVADNPFLDEGREGYGESIPYGDQEFDIVFADNVLEHLPDPLAVFREVHRVLRPGGVFLAKTPNRWHYVPLIASLTPHWFHQWVNERRGREAEDTFPTLYRANSSSRVRNVAREAGFTRTEVTLIEGRPEYLRMSVPTYLIGAAWERAVNAVDALSGLRVLLVIESTR